MDLNQIKMQEGCKSKSLMSLIILMNKHQVDVCFTEILSDMLIIFIYIQNIIELIKPGGF